MCLVVVLMVEMVGMGGMWCWSAMPRGVISVLFAVASTFGLGVEGVAKGRIDMGLGGRSF